MRLPFFILISLSLANAEGAEGTEKPAFMERIVQTLPQIPNVIKGQMEGKPEELKKLISSMLGDGLLSQLVVNPMGVAENMGVPLTDLGINSTVLDKSLNMGSSGEKKDGSAPAFNLFNAFTTTPATTTVPIMYVDGVPVKNMDDFIRRHDLEKHGYSTKSPPTTTTPLSSENIAEVVLNRLKSQETPVLAPPPRQIDVSNNLDMNLIDPSRVAEVNRLLRRAPQKFAPEPSDLGAPLDIESGPPGFVQSLDPAIDEVVTNLRTRGGYGLSVDDVKRLQNILQNYEQTLQTKELLAKRKQLQVLSTELTEQRKRIEVQKKMEEDLKKKEKELEEAQLKMEQQLKEQLNSWHSSFGPTGQRTQIPFDLQSFGASPPAPMIPTTTTTPLPETSTTPELPSSHERKLSEERENIVEQQMQPVPPPQPIKISSALRHHIRYSPTPVVSEPVESVPPSTSVQKEDDEFVSKCDCEQVSFDKMNGKWVIALASTNVAQQINERVSSLIDKENEKLTCSRFDFSAGKQSVAAQDARLVWQFKTSSIAKLLRLRGNALTMDHESVRVQMTDFDGESFSFPFCVIKSGGDSQTYNHLIVTNSQGDCKDVAILVRDPQEFFDHPDKKLQRYLKTEIAKKKMNTLDVLDFGDC